MLTCIQPPNDRPHGPHASKRCAEQSLRALIPESRLSPALRHVLQGLGVRIRPAVWSGDGQPELAIIVAPPPGPDPEWLDAFATETLMDILKDMARAGRAPGWAQAMLVHHRAGTLLDGDGALELADGLSAQGLAAAVLRLPGHT